MIAGLLRLVILRVFGARVLLALGVLGWIRNRLRSHRTTADEDARRTRTTSRRST